MFEHCQTPDKGTTEDADEIEGIRLKNTEIAKVSTFISGNDNKKSTFISSGQHKNSTFISDSSWKSQNRLLFAKCSELSRKQTGDGSTSVSLIRKTGKQTLMIFTTFFITFITFPSLILYNELPFLVKHAEGDDWT